MSENNTKLDGTFDIFNLGSKQVEDPFAGMENAPAQEPAVEAPAPQEQPAQPQPEQEAPTAPPVQPTAPAVPTAQPTAPTAQPENPLAAAAAKAEEKQAVVTAESLFSKPPVFEYGGASEDVTDTSKTFEELRIEKAADFPELEDGKRVSWTMEYGKIVKSVATPGKTTISKLKSEIENSKEFIEALKKAKDKDIVCKVKPKITAQSKGVAAYKGIFSTLEEAEASDKVICILPARDGRVYELRRNEIGRFTAPVENVRELSEIRAGFMPALPPVPFEQFAQVIAFFQSFMQEGCEAEAFVHIYWDKAERWYRIVPPMQSVSKAHIDAVTPTDEEISGERYVHVADIHSHNSMPAFFSETDNADERATRVYMVVGMLDQPFPAISARVSVGGRFVPIDAKLVIDFPNLIDSLHLRFGWPSPQFNAQLFDRPEASDFPAEWSAAVNVSETVTPGHRQIDIPLPERGFRRFFRTWRRGESA